MGSYDLGEVIRRWGSGSLSVEQAIGQILQLIQEYAGRLGSLEQQLAQRQPKRESGQAPAHATPPTPDAGQGEETQADRASNRRDSGTVHAK